MALVNEDTELSSSLVWPSSQLLLIYSRDVYQHPHSTSPSHYWWDSVWSVPFSVALTYGIAFVFFSFAYYDASLQQVPVSIRIMWALAHRDAHSGIPGSKTTCV